MMGIKLMEAVQIKTLVRLGNLFFQRACDDNAAEKVDKSNQ
jgi:hypothetical protein